MFTNWSRCAGKLIRVDAHRVTVGGKQTYGCVNMSDFLEKLQQKLEPNPTSLKNYRRMFAPRGLHKADPKGPLETAVLYDRVQVFGLRHSPLPVKGECAGFLQWMLKQK